MVRLAGEPVVQVAQRPGDGFLEPLGSQSHSVVPGHDQHAGVARAVSVQGVSPELAGSTGGDPEADHGVAPAQGLVDDGAQVGGAHLLVAVPAVVELAGGLVQLDQRAQGRGLPDPGVRGVRAGPDLDPAFLLVVRQNLDHLGSSGRVT